MSEFLTGCTHFGHKNIIGLAARHFNSIDQMDEALIENWNKTVGKKDAVYHLGDFAWRTHNHKQYRDALNGNIHFLQGNHDPKNWGLDYMELKRDGVKIVLFHYPIEEWNGWFRDSVHFHCHTHNVDFISGERRANVGVDACDFHPIELSEAVKRAKRGLTHIK